MSINLGPLSYCILLANGAVLFYLSIYFLSISCLFHYCPHLRDALSSCPPSFSHTLPPFFIYCASFARKNARSVAPGIIFRNTVISVTSCTNALTTNELAPLITWKLITYIFQSPLARSSFSRTS